MLKPLKYNISTASIAKLVLFVCASVACSAAFATSPWAYVWGYGIAVKNISPRTICLVGDWGNFDELAPNESYANHYFGPAGANSIRKTRVVQGKCSQVHDAKHKDATIGYFSYGLVTNTSSPDRNPTSFVQRSGQVHGGKYKLVPAYEPSAVPGRGTRYNGLVAVYMFYVD